jgi:hypothetical protein
MRRLQQGFTTSGMGLRRQLHSNNPEQLMSAMGQKRTFSDVRLMSALPPKADIVGRNGDVRFVPKADIPPSIISSASARTTSAFDAQNKFKLVCPFDSSHLCHSGL